MSKERKKVRWHVWLIVLALLCLSVYGSYELLIFLWSWDKIVFWGGVGMMVGGYGGMMEQLFNKE